MRLHLSLSSFKVSAANIDAVNDHTGLDATGIADRNQIHGSPAAMRTALLLCSLALLFLSVLAENTIRIDDFRHVEILAWPLSAAKPLPLARLAYNFNRAVIEDYTPPALAADEEVVRVGFYRPSGAWAGVATAAANLAPGKLGQRLQLLVDEQAELYHVGFTVAPGGAGASQGDASSTRDGLSVEVRELQQGATPILDKPVVVSPDGAVEGEVPEKSLLQKYWWAPLAFLVLQAVLAGGKDEEGGGKK